VVLAAVPSSLHPHAKAKVVKNKLLSPVLLT